MSCDGNESFEGYIYKKESLSQGHSTHTLKSIQTPLNPIPCTFEEGVHSIKKEGNGPMHVGKARRGRIWAISVTSC